MNEFRVDKTGNYRARGGDIAVVSIIRDRGTHYPAKGHINNSDFSWTLMGRVDYPKESQDDLVEYIETLEYDAVNSKQKTHKDFVENMTGEYRDKVIELLERQGYRIKPPVNPILFRARELYISFCEIKNESEKLKCFDGYFDNKDEILLAIRGIRAGMEMERNRIAKIKAPEDK
jgi:hypothetical protein